MFPLPVATPWVRPPKRFTGNEHIHLCFFLLTCGKRPHAAFIIPSSSPVPFLFLLITKFVPLTRLDFLFFSIFCLFCVLFHIIFSIWVNFFSNKLFLTRSPSVFPLSTCSLVYFSLFSAFFQLAFYLSSSITITLSSTLPNLFNFLSYLASRFSPRFILYHNSMFHSFIVSTSLPLPLILYYRH